jgi:transcriptional regulator with XRE-family HTH domain
MNNFSARLKGLMETHGLTQQRLAEKARTSQASIYRYLNTETLPQPRVAELLAAVFKVSPTWLLTGKGDKFAPNPETDTHYRFPPGQAAATLAPQIPEDITRLMDEAHASPFAHHTDPEIWDFIATTAQNAPSEKPLNQRLYLGNLLSAVQELQRRLPGVSYRNA